jgi:hypothetical protein
MNEEDIEFEWMPDTGQRLEQETKRYCDQFLRETVNCGSSMRILPLLPKPLQR